MTTFRWKRFFMGALLLALLGATYLAVHNKDLLPFLMDPQQLKVLIQNQGAWGPLAIIVTMTFAIIMSPIPSAPIALVSGALYGPTWGTLYIILGSEMGALIAFLLARLLGHEVLKKYLGEKLFTGFLGSQKHLTLFIFFSRLLPFISFDLVSYAAGLTTISVGRFAFATLLGITPISFVLAHFGQEIGSADPKRVIAGVLFLGGITGFTVILKKVFDKKRR